MADFVAVMHIEYVVVLALDIVLICKFVRIYLPVGDKRNVFVFKRERENLLLALCVKPSEKSISCLYGILRSRDFGVVILFRLVSFFSVYFSARKVERNDVFVYRPFCRNRHVAIGHGFGNGRRPPVKSISSSDGIGRRRDCRSVVLSYRVYRISAVGIEINRTAVYFPARNERRVFRRHRFGDSRRPAGESIAFFLRHVNCGNFGSEFSRNGIYRAAAVAVKRKRNGLCFPFGDEFFVFKLFCKRSKHIALLVGENSAEIIALPALENVSGAGRNGQNAGLIKSKRGFVCAVCNKASCGVKLAVKRFCVYIRNKSKIVRHRLARNKLFAQPAAELITLLFFI